MILHELALREPGREFDCGRDQLARQLRCSPEHAGRMLKILRDRGFITRVRLGNNLLKMVSRYRWNGEPPARPDRVPEPPVPTPSYHTADNAMNTEPAPTTPAAKAPLLRRHRGMDFHISPAHPIANIPPWMEEDALQRLAENIATNGQDEDILKLPDGHIVDGRNRELACLVAGVKPRYRTVEMSDQEIIKLVWNKNCERRHLTASQRAMIAAEFAKLNPGQKANGSHDLLTQTSAAKLLDVSATTVKRAAAVKKKAPELVEPVRDGRLDVNTAWQLTGREDITESTRQRIATAPNPKAVAEEVLAVSSAPATNRVPAEVVRDERGRIVPDALVSVFKQGREFVREVRRKHNELINSIHAAGKSPFGMAFTKSGPTLEQDYRKIAKGVAASVPYCVCPHIDQNTGRHIVEGKCRLCVENRGWLTRDNWETLAPPIKSLIDEHAEPNTAEADTDDTPSVTRPKSSGTLAGSQERLEPKPAERPSGKTRYRSDDREPSSTNNMRRTA